MLDEGMACGCRVEIHERNVCGEMCGECAKQWLDAAERVAVSVSCGVSIRLDRSAVLDSLWYSGRLRVSIVFGTLLIAGGGA